MLIGFPAMHCAQLIVPQTGPLTTPGLNFWYDSANGASIGSSGGTVTSIADLSGNGYMASGGSLTTGSVTIGGANAFGSAGYSSRIQMGGFPSNFWQSANTVIALHALTGDNQSSLGGQNGGSIVTGFGITNFQQHMYYQNGNQAYINVSGTQPTDPHIMVGTYDGAGNINVWMDGATYAASVSGASGQPNINGTYMGLGGNFSIMQGYTQVLTNAQINFLCNQIVSQRTGLSWTNI